MGASLRINREKFAELYPDLAEDFDFFNNPVPAGVSADYFESVYLHSKLWRLNNLYSITDKHANVVKFNMNLAQHKVYAAHRKHPRVIILKSRQQGISTLWLVSFFDDLIFGENLKIGLMAQGTDEAVTLFERAKFLWEMLDPDVKNFLNLRIEKDNIKELSFSNNCKMFIRVSFRSTTLQRLHISEFGKIANADPQRARETKTGTLQALAKGCTGIIESTAEGQNEFKLTWDNSVASFTAGSVTLKDFCPVFLSWMDDPDCVESVRQADTAESIKYFAELEESTGVVATQEQKNFWIMQYRELGDDIYQEYPGSPEEAFRKKLNGAFWAKLFQSIVVRNKRIVTNLYDPNLPVDVYIDLGVDDYTVFTFLQVFEGEYRIVGEDFGQDHDLMYYVRRAEARGWNIRAYRFPHDIEVRQIITKNSSSDLARSRREILAEEFRKANISARIDTLQRTSNKANGIDMVRIKLIPNLVIDVTCVYIRQCFENFTKKFDVRLGVWTNEVLHDEFSHGADTIIAIVEHAYVNVGLTNTTRRRTSGHAV